MNKLTKPVAGGKILLLSSVLAISAPMQAEIAMDALNASTEISQQKITVKGTVVDENGEPVPGASVYVKGTKQGTITDIDGRFTLSINPGQTLIASFVEYLSVEKTVNQSNETMTFTLVPDNKVLDEVVVTGYQTISKERATGSFTVLTPEKMQGKLQTNILDRMEGMVAGMKKAPNQSAPEIRGVSTLMGTKTPLYVVDGMPYEGDIDAINPSDIVNNVSSMNLE